MTAERVYRYNRGLMERKNPDGTSHFHGTRLSMRIQNDERRTNRFQKDFRIFNARMQNQNCRETALIASRAHSRISFASASESDSGRYVNVVGSTPNRNPAQTQA